MRTIAVEPTRLEACAGQIEQLRQEVERTVARLYERVELMAANTWIGRDNLAFTTQIQGYQDDFRRVELLMQQYSEFLKTSARSYRQMQEELAAQASRLANLREEVKMDNLKISLAGVKDTSGAIRVCNEQIYSALIEAKKQMNDLAMVWQSDGSEAIRQRFNQFAAQFETQKQIIESYARFLDTAVSSYDTLEATIQNNAGSF